MINSVRNGAKSFTVRNGDYTMKERELTADQLSEIQKLQQSEFVKLARKEQRLKYRQRQFLYTLRNLEKRGRQLASEGVTLDNLEKQLADLEFRTGELTEAETV